MISRMKSRDRAVSTLLMNDVLALRIWIGARVCHPAAAKREVLLALEETPRFRAALDLLLAIDTAKAPKPYTP